MVRTRNNPSIQPSNPLKTSHAICTLYTATQRTQERSLHYLQRYYTLGLQLKRAMNERNVHVDIRITRYNAD